jgi:hypothetical protein
MDELKENQKAADKMAKLVVLYAGNKELPLTSRDIKKKKGYEVCA